MKSSGLILIILCLTLTHGSIGFAQSTPEVRIDLPTFNDMTIAIDTCEESIISLNKQLSICDSMVLNRDGVIVALKQTLEERTFQYNQTAQQKYYAELETERVKKTRNILWGVAGLLATLLYVSK